MITTNLKLKVWSRKSSYDMEYALRYLDRRKSQFNQDRNFFRELIKKYNINLENETVLDLAAGVGMDLKILSEFAPKTLIWHDKMPRVYEVARENLKNLNNIIFNLKDIMDTEGYKSNSIKLAICHSSLCYIGNDFLFFKEIKRILQTNGFFYGQNSSFKWYKNLPNKSIINLIRTYFFDWPLYKFTGLRFFSFGPVNPDRLRFIFKKLNFKIPYFAESDDGVRFLISK